jgi:hypothetical protein
MRRRRRTSAGLQRACFLLHLVEDWGVPLDVAIEALVMACRAECLPQARRRQAGVEIGRLLAAHVRR